ncbi:hypothetical protein GOBAR_AA23560 [Gossypium barbadense]|uniref:AP-3 complex subunit beta C-terminal domain-containing protein n=1 Tax=Gossypium barbadense TaxID=3634 RepID=A0A2P5X174_GOSBA|nr:hypothetical protein GOBAR_AA23560 [Gossypium barbadense]
MVFRFGTDAHLYDDPDDVNIAPLLDSKYDSEKCEALKRLLALIAKGLDVSNFFPQVVKNVASQSLELKKLVYLYLLHYAEKHPNEALLSINCFQKDLGDPNPLVRAWALRTMAGIRLHVIAPLVLVAVNRCARDPTVYVRKCAANALPKLHDLRLEEQKSALEEILPDVEEWGQIVLIGILLRYVIARHGLVKESVMSSLQCTDNFHSEKDVSDDDFRLAKESNHSGACDSEFVNMVSRGYIEGPDEYFSRSSYAKRVPFELNDAQFTSGKSNEDVKILLYSTSPLLRSKDSAVVLAAACVHWIMAPKEDVKRIIKPLLFILRSSNVSKYVNSDQESFVLRWSFATFKYLLKQCHLSLLHTMRTSSFYSSDSYQVKALKLEILSSIATDSSISSIFKEFQDYIRDPDRRFAAATVAAIGICTRQLPKMAHICVDGLLTLTRQGLLLFSYFLLSGNIQRIPLFSEVIPNFAELLTKDLGSRYQEADVLVQATISIKSIIKQDPPIHEKVIVQLVRSLDSIKVPSVRAMIIWMVGEYSSLGEIIPRMLTTVLKYLAWCFTSEALETKLQILSTVTKVLSGATGEGLSTFKKVFRYLVELAECDSNYDVRDLACFLKELLSYNFISQGSQGVYSLSEKDLHIVVNCIFRKQREVKTESINYRFYLPGSLSHMVLHTAPGYEPLPKPCSLLLDDINEPEGTRIIMKEAADYSGTDDHGTSSDPSDNESASDYGSQHSFSGSRSSGHGDDGESNEGNDNADLLLQISDIGNAAENQNGVFHSSPANLGELMSNRALESWLEEQPGSSNPGMLEQSQVRKSLARISIGDVGKRIKPKSYSLLKPANRNDLKVDYSFSSEISSISRLLVCIEVSFKNCSSETISGIKLVNVESNRASSDNVPTLVPMEEIASLEPGQTTRRIIQVYFHHHLLPLKLALFYDAFTDKESRLPGMFEYSRSCPFTDHIEELNKEPGDSLSTENKILAICLRLRFSSEILSSSIPCLITLTVEGKCSDPLNLSIKVNCEETVLGLNLLNRMVNFLVEPAHS